MIPAGGVGSRLWPLSRAEAPKFLHDLTGSGHTLLRDTWNRVLPLTGSDGGVRCECDHLTDFVVVKVHPCPTTSSPPAAHRRCVSVQVPSNWDELAASVLEGFHVNVFTWEQARLHGCSYHISPRPLTLTHPTQRLHVLP